MRGPKPIKPPCRAFMSVAAAGLALVWTSQSYAETAMQCNQKLSSTLFGRSATTAELNIADPKSRVDAMMQNQEFIEHFSSYVNAHMEWIPDDGIRNNPVYGALTFYLFQNGEEKPWHELFTGNYGLYDNGYNPQSDGSGYFSDREWKRKYKGNEEDGFKLRTAYMIMNNSIGLNLEALTVNNSGGSGRDARQDPNSVCYACHYKEEFALDRIANVLPQVNREASDAQNLIENPPPGPTPQIIYGAAVSNLDELVDSLVTTDEFYTNACHIAFNFVFGRDERGADKEIFKSCLDEFRTDGRISVAVRHFIDSEIFCKDLEG